MSEHTKGPWIVDGSTIYALNESGINRFSAHVEQGFASETSRGVTSIEEIRANARIMGAAPDLLEALKEAELQLEYVDERNPTGTTPVILQRIKAAIAKAEGGGE